MQVEEMVNVDEKEYLEIIARLEDNHLAEVVEKSQEWEVIRKAAKHVRDMAQQQLNSLDFTKEESKLKAINCQVAIQFYDNFLLAVLENYKTRGKEAYVAADNSGWLDGIQSFLKNNF